MTIPQNQGCQTPFPTKVIEPNLLPEWCQHLLSGYVTTLDSAVETDKTRGWYISIANRTVQFFLAEGACNCDTISYRMMQNCTLSIARCHVPALRSFAKYIGSITDRPYLHYLANLKHTNRVVWDDHGELKPLSEGGISIQRVEQIADELYQHRKLYGFSTSHTNQTLLIKTDFCTFLAANDLLFTLPLAKRWCEIVEQPPISLYTSQLHGSLCWIDAIASGHKPSEMLIFPKTRAAIPFPKWSKELAEQYLEHRKQDRMSPSTINMSKQCIRRFLCYADSQGFHSYKDFSVDLVKSFNTNDTNHKTNEAKNAYNVRIRLFLRWLFEGGIIDRDLGSALPANSAPIVRPVKVLSKEQQDRLNEYCHHDQKISSTYLRDVAILKLMRHMGLRACDVAGLNFGSIDLCGQVLNISQQKTGKALSLPIPTHVLNSIISYIKQERPVPFIKTERVFLGNRAPFRPITTQVVITTVRTVLGISNPHILRRTFATEMMLGQNDLHLIAHSLGHSDHCNVHKYLNTDQKRMLACTLTLRGMSYNGSLL